jgi:hypothetical protein
MASSGGAEPATIKGSGLLSQLLARSTARVSTVLAKTAARSWSDPGPDGATGGADRRLLPRDLNLGDGNAAVAATPEPAALTFVSPV